MKYNIENIVRDNKVFIVGKLKSFDLSEHADLNGSPVPHIRGKVTVVSSIPGAEEAYTFDLNVFQYKNNASGQVNKGYSQLRDLMDEAVNLDDRVRVSAGFTMSKFKDDSRNELVEAKPIKDVGQKALMNMMDQVSSFAAMEQIELSPMEKSFAMAAILHISKQLQT